MKPLKLTLDLKHIERGSLGEEFYLSSYRFPLEDAQGLERRCLALEMSMASILIQLVQAFNESTEDPGDEVELKKTLKATVWKKPVKELAPGEVRRGPGRPRKVLPEPENEEFDLEEAEPVLPVKRGPGRPPKAQVVTQVAPPSIRAKVFQKVPPPKKVSLMGAAASLPAKGGAAKATLAKLRNLE